MTRERRNPGTPARATSTTPIADTDSIANGRPCVTWRAAPLHRRRNASRRLVPLDCGCRDPWPCKCSWPPLSEQTVDAGRDAARYILATGRIPLLETEVLQALWRRGGADRQLAEQLHELTGGVAA